MLVKIIFVKSKQLNSLLLYETQILAELVGLADLTESEPSEVQRQALQCVIRVIELCKGAQGEAAYKAIGEHLVPLVRRVYAHCWGAVCRRAALDRSLLEFVARCN